MKLVVLDSVPLDQGDMDWASFKKFGDLVIHERTKPEEVISRCVDANIVFTNKVILNQDFFDQCSQLQLVQVMATGTDIVDLNAAGKHRVIVCKVPAYSTHSVVEHVLSFILELVRGTGNYNHLVHLGEWAQSPDFSFFLYPIRDLNQMHIGIVGSGNIGTKLAKVCRALGMKVTFANIPGRPFKKDAVPLDELLPQVDILSLNCPLTELTSSLMNEERLRLLPGNSFLINASRGPVIDEEALVRVLKSGHLAGVALDVLSEEPPLPNHPLLKAPRCLITPHVAWGSVASRLKLMDEMEKNISAWIQGQARNVVTD